MTPESIQGKLLPDDAEQLLLPLQLENIEYLRDKELDALRKSAAPELPEAA